MVLNTNSSSRAPYKTITRHHPSGTSSLFSNSIAEHPYGLHAGCAPGDCYNTLRCVSPDGLAVSLPLFWR